MQVDILAIAQELIDELTRAQATNKARVEGVAMLYEKIRAAAEKAELDSASVTDVSGE